MLCAYAPETTLYRGAGPVGLVGLQPKALRFPALANSGVHTNWVSPLIFCKTDSFIRQIPPGRSFPATSKLNASIRLLAAMAGTRFSVDFPVSFDSTNVRANECCA